MGKFNLQSSEGEETSREMLLAILAESCGFFDLTGKQKTDLGFFLRVSA